jgi:hypothetical protein
VSLIAEDGSGVPGAASYASIAAADAYWSERAHNALATTWAAAGAPQKEGALREATAYLDATYGPHYRGERRGYLQGLLWPRTNALDEAGYPLPDLPREVVDAVCELAARALGTRLVDDAERGGVLKRFRVDQVEMEWATGVTAEARYRIVAGMMAQVCFGSQPTWHWR